MAEKEQRRNIRDQFFENSNWFSTRFSERFPQLVNVINSRNKYTANLTSRVQDAFNKYILGERETFLGGFKNRSIGASENTVSNIKKETESTFRRTMQRNVRYYDDLERYEKFKEEINLRKLEKRKERFFETSLSNVEVLDNQAKKLAYKMNKSHNIDYAMKSPDIIDSNTYLKKISRLENDYIELTKKQIKTLPNELKGKTIIDASTKEEYANIIRKDIDNIRQKAIKEIRPDLIGKNSFNVKTDYQTNTDWFNKLLSENKDFAYDYYQKLRRITKPIVDETRTQNIFDFEKYYLKRVHDFRPEVNIDAYDSLITNPSRLKANSLNLGQFGIQQISDQSTRHYENKLKKTLDFHIAQGEIKKPKEGWFKNVPMGDGIEGRQFSADIVVGKNKTERLDLIIPKVKNTQFKWKVGNKTFISPIMALKGRYSQFDAHNVETMSMMNLLKFAQIIDDVRTRGVEEGKKTAEKIMRRGMEGTYTLAEHNINDVARAGSFINLNLKKTLSGKVNIEKDKIAARSLVNFRRAVKTGAYRVLYDIETITDDASAGPQVMRDFNKTSIYNIGLSVYDDTGKLVDSINLWHNPKNIDINSDSAKQIIKNLDLNYDSIVKNVSSNHMDKGTLLRKINSFLDNIKHPYIIGDYNGTEFDRKQIMNFFGGLHGGEFLDRLRNPDATIDMEKVYRMLDKEEGSKKLSQIVHFDIFKGKGQRFESYRDKASKKLLQLYEKKKRTGVGDLRVHTPLIDNDMLNMLMNYTKKTFGVQLGKADNYLSYYEKLSSYPSLDKSIELLNIANRQKAFLGEAGTKRHMEMTLDYSMLSPSRAAKGIQTVVDASKFSPFGLFNSLDRQLYQVHNGIKMRSMNRQEKKAYKEFWGVNPFAAPLETEYFQNVKKTMSSLNQYKRIEQRLPITNVFFNLTENAMTFNEGAVVHNKLAEMFNPEDVVTKNIRLPMALDLKNVDAGFFHDNITAFAKTKFGILQDLKKNKPHLSEYERNKIASTETAKALGNANRKIKPGEYFINKDADIRNSINKYGLDMNLMDVHFLDPDKSKEIQDIVLHLQYNQPIGVGTAVHTLGSAHATVTDMKEMFILNRRKTHGKIMERNIPIGIMHQPKFFSRNEFGGLLQGLITRSVWHDIEYNKGQNIKQIANKLNVKFNKTKLGVQIADAGEKTAEALMKGNFSLETIGEIFKLVGNVYTVADINSINKNLNISVKADRQILARKINKMAVALAEKVDLTHSGFKTRVDVEEYFKKQFSVFHKFKEGEARFLDVNETTGDVGIYSPSPFSIRDRVKSGMKITPHQIRLTAADQMREKLMSPENARYLDNIFGTFRGGKRGVALQEFVDIDFVIRKFLGLKDHSRFAPDTKTVRSMEKTDLQRLTNQMLQRNYFGKQLSDVTKDDVDKFFGFPIGTDNYKRLRKQLANARPLNSLRDLTWTFFDKEAMKDYGGVFKYTLQKPISIDVNDQLQRVKMHDDMKNTFKQQFRSLMDRTGNTNMQMEVKDLFLVNPARYMDESMEKRLFHPKKSDLAFTNLMTMIDAYESPGMGKSKVNEKILGDEIFKYYFYSFNEQMRKKKGLAGKATEVRIPAAMGEAVSMFNEMNLKRVKTGNLKFGTVPIPLSVINQMRQYDPKLDMTLHNLYKDFSSRTGTNINMNKWILDTFKPGSKYALPSMLVRYPLEQNEFVPNIMAQIVDDTLKGVRPNEIPIPIDPIIWNRLQGDFDTDRAGAAWDLIRNMDELEMRVDAVRNQYYQKNGKLKRHWKREIADNFNKANIRYNDKQLSVDEFGQYVLKNFDAPIDLLEKLAPSPIVAKLAGYEKITDAAKRALFLEQAQKPIIQLFSKLAIPTANTTVRNAVSLMTEMAMAGDDLTINSLLSKRGNKFTSKAVDVVKDFQNFSQQIISLKSTQDKATNLIQDRINLLHMVQNLDNENYQRELISRGFFTNTAPEAGEVIKAMRQLMKDQEMQSARRLIQGRKGGTALDLVTALTGAKNSREISIGQVHEILGFSGTNRSTISTEMAKGFWDEFSETYGKRAESLKSAGKMVGVAGLAYLALNFFRPDQISNKYNPLDLFMDLGPQEGYGGEEFDYLSKNYGVGRFTPIDIPEVEFEGKTRVLLDDPYAEDKREIRSLQKLEQYLSEPEEGFVNVPFRKQVNYWHNNRLERIDRMRIRDIMNRGGAVFR